MLTPKWPQITNLQPSFRPRNHCYDENAAKQKENMQASWLSDVIIFSMVVPVSRKHNPSHESQRGSEAFAASICQTTTRGVEVRAFQVCERRDL